MFVDIMSSNEIDADEMSLNKMTVDKMAWRRNSQYGGLFLSNMLAIFNECISLVLLFRICLCHNQVRNT